MHKGPMTQAVHVPVSGHLLAGDLTVPAGAAGLVLFAHGSGSSRHSPRNHFVARTLEQRGLGTLLIDLLTPEEEEVDRMTSHLRFAIPMLAGRLVGIIDWLRTRPATKALPVGLFGASTGGGAAIVAAADRPRDVAAVVSRGGRPDLAAEALDRVTAPTLLIVGGLDTAVIRMNRDAQARMHGHAVIEIVPGATHLFEEPGTLERVARSAGDWFERHLRPAKLGAA
jgi:dienelactone hydrolase